MQARKLLIALFAVAALSAAGTAQAGPTVTVTFKNQGTAIATYKIITANESTTNMNAQPKPQAQVAAGSSDVYAVQSTVSPNVNYAAVRYDIGTKECAFYTAFVNGVSPSGGTTPTWSKSATPSGGATCTATITSANTVTHEWAVEFDMK